MPSTRRWGASSDTATTTGEARAAGYTCQKRRATLLHEDDNTQHTVGRTTKPVLLRTRPFAPSPPPSHPPLHSSLPTFSVAPRAILLCDERFADAPKRASVSKWLRPFLKSPEAFGRSAASLQRFFNALTQCPPGTAGGAGTAPGATVVTPFR